MEIKEPHTTESIALWLKSENPFHWLGVASRARELRLQNEGDPKNELPRINTDTRLLCEMPICYHIPNVVFPPQEFGIIAGRVSKIHGHIHVPHTFLYHFERQLIVCLTPGQFADELSRHKGDDISFSQPGDRIKYLIDLATGTGITFTPHSSGNHIMICTPDELEKIGIDYI